MTVRITPVDTRRRAVTLLPTWWEWLLGRRERTLYAIAVPDIGGGWAWIDDAKDCRIADRRVLQALGVRKPITER